MADINIPNIPDISGKTILADTQLREILTAMKITLEQLTGATIPELDDFLSANSTFGLKNLQGQGTPENSIKAPVGSTYLRIDGGTSTTLYVKESGDGSTGWVAK